MERARRIYDRTIGAAVVVAFSTMILAALAGTLTRYLTFLPVIVWGEEVTRFAGIWSSFLVSGMAIRRGAHLGVDLLTFRLSKRHRRALYLATCLAMLAFCGLLVVYGVILAAQNADQVSPALEISMGLIYLCIPIGGALMGFEICILARDWLEGLPPPKPHVEDVIE